MSMPARVDLADAFVLHTYPYRETSLIADIFSREHGRLSVVARGARRPKSTVRAVLLPFQPVQLSWFGQGELRTLHKSEWMGGVRMLAGTSLLCGYYLNELLLALIPREDAAPDLYDHYHRTVVELALGRPPAACIRAFELTLLRETGYGLQLEQEAVSGDLVSSSADYWFRPQVGVLPGTQVPQAGDVPVRGEVLLALAGGDYSAAAVQSRALVRAMVSSVLPDKVFMSRALLVQLQQWGDEPA